MIQQTNQRKKILACSGGGAHTTSYIGFWKYVYDEKKYQPDCIYGTSGGALFGCFMAAGLSAQEIGDAIEKYKPWKHFRIAPLMRLTNFVFHWGLVRINKIEGLLEEILNDYNITWDSFKDTEFQCVVTDVNDGKRRYVPQDVYMKLSTAISASIAIPGIFEPVRTSMADGTKHYFVDGGVCEGYPIKAALQRGRKNVKIFAISPFDLTHSRDYTFTRKLQYAHALYRTLLDAKGEDMIDLLDANKGDYYLPTGYESSHVLDFDLETIKKNIDLGYHTAKESKEKINDFFQTP